MKNIKLYLSIALAVVLLLLGGYFGYKIRVGQEKPCPSVEVKVDTFEVVSKDTVVNPVPYYVVNTIHDTLKTKVDTALILDDYYKKKKYAFDFSTDSTGRFKVDVTVNKNAVSEITSDIKALVKEVKVTKTEYVPKVPFAQVFATVGSDTKFTTQKAQVGVDFKQKYIIGVSGIRYLDKFSYTIDLGIKF